MRLGVRYDLRSGDDEPQDTAARYAAVLAHAEAAEQAGVDVLWVAERPFAPGALLPAAFPVCAALSQRTTRARIATGVVPLPLHHPLRVAEDAATLDVLSGGRFELGVGLGEHSEGFDGFGIPLRERAGRLEEALALLVQAWTEPEVSFAGRHFQIDGVAVHPRPVQRPHPPLWIAAHAQAAVERAARVGAGLLTDSHDAARRFLAARADAVPAGGAARIAWHLDPGGDPSAALGRFEEVVAAFPGASLDLVVPATSGETPERLAALASGLRSRFAGDADPAGTGPEGV